MAKTIQIPGSLVKTIPLSSIREGERYRKEYGDLSELMHSIRMYGLINPITVNPLPDPFEEGQEYILVAGGRRLAALRELKMEEALVRIFPEPLSELDLRILELAENLQRKDMTWSEQNNLQREIHRLQQEKYGKAQAGGLSLSEKEKATLKAMSAEQVSDVGPVGGWRLEDTANMLGVSKAQVQNSVQLADKFDKYKEILGDPSQYKTENDARKAIKIVEESIIRAELAKRIAAKKGTSVVSSLAEKYLIGDVLEELEKVESESLNFAEVDPPYSIDLDEHKRNNPCEEYNEVPAQEFIIFNAKVLHELYRILKDDSFCIYWYGQEPWLETLYQLAKQEGFILNRIPLIWVKPNGQSLSPDRNLANAYETALILKKGSPILAKPGRINVFSYTPVAPNKKYHPTQKPLDLYQDLFQTFCFEGAKCISPFLGSGQAILGAETSRRSCFGWDLSEEFRKGFIKNVNDYYLQAEEVEEKKDDKQNS